jgi:hypothetical protein
MLLVVAFSALLCACPLTYMGIYSLRPSEGASLPSASEVSAELDDALRDFGFVRNGPSRSAGASAGEGDWATRSAEAAPAFRRLHGSDAYVTVAVSERSMTVAIRDLDNVDETEFVHALRERIEQRLTQRFGLPPPSFVRQRWTIVPNS